MKFNTGNNLKKTADEVLYNCRTKVDAFGAVYEIIIFNEPVFNPDGWELSDSVYDRDDVDIIYETSECCPEDNEPAFDNKDESLLRSKRRARKSIVDITLNNVDMNQFVTLTLDKDKIDRYNYKEVIKKYNIWLSNMVQRKGLKYILVAEYHKDGAIHFHGLTNDIWTKIDSGMKTKRGQTIWNIKEYKYGHNTCVTSDGNVRACTKYIVKYITKGDEIVGGRYFLHGGDIKKPQVIYSNADYSVMKGWEINITDRRTCKVVTGF